MTISIIGAGRLGAAIGRAFATNNVPTQIANSRGPESLADLTGAIGKNIVAVPLAEALAADIVVLAAPWPQLENILGDAPSWKGRILIDATNALDYLNADSPEAKDPTNPFAKYGSKPVDIGDRTSSEIVADLVPGAKVVKAFNHVHHSVLQNPEVAGGKRVLLISGDDDGAKGKVRKLLEQIGFSVADLGSLDVGARLQGFPFGTLSALNLIRI